MLGIEYLSLHSHPYVVQYLVTAVVQKHAHYRQRNNVLSKLHHEFVYGRRLVKASEYVDGHSLLHGLLLSRTVLAVGGSSRVTKILLGSCVVDDWLFLIRLIIVSVFLLDDVHGLFSLDDGRRYEFARRSFVLLAAVFVTR